MKMDFLPVSHCLGVFFLWIFILICYINLISIVTEVIWEGEETEAKKTDSYIIKTADSDILKKSDSKAPGAVNRLI